MEINGACHCGAVTFTVQAEENESVLRCNCSICKMKGFLHLIVPPDRFNLLSGEDSLETYRFNTKIAVHRFCKRCGIHPFYTPRSHPHDVDVNVNCLKVPETFFSIEDFDGQNWENNVDSIR